MNVCGMRWYMAGLACVMAAGLSGCSQGGKKNQEPVAAEEGTMGGAIMRCFHVLWGAGLWQIPNFRKGILTRTMLIPGM